MFCLLKSKKKKKKKRKDKKIHLCSYALLSCISSDFLESRVTVCFKFLTFFSWFKLKSLSFDPL